MGWPADPNYSNHEAARRWRDGLIGVGAEQRELGGCDRWRWGGCATQFNNYSN